MPVRTGLPVICAICLLSQTHRACAQDEAALPTGTEFRSLMLHRPAADSTPAPSIVTNDAAIERPAALPRLSSRFGERRDPFGGRTRLHTGIDIPGPLGTPVFAAQAGEVRRAGDAGGYGRMVEIDHGNGLRTRYAHLSRIDVRPGEHVAEGQVIGLMGSTGRSTGSHLHFEVRRGGTALDPLDYLAPPEEPFSAPRAPLEAAEPHISDFARSRDAASNLNSEYTVE